MKDTRFYFFSFPLLSQEKPITGAKTPPQESAQDEVFEAVFELVEEQPQILPTQAPDEIPPEFVELLQPQVVVEGESVTMTCKLIGSPAPSVTWYRNSIVIESGPDIKVTYDIPTGVCILEIAEVFPEDAGEVVCRAVNPFGEAMTSANLLVQGLLIYYSAVRSGKQRDVSDLKSL